MCSNLNFGIGHKLTGENQQTSQNVETPHWRILPWMKYASLTSLRHAIKSWVEGRGDANGRKPITIAASSFSTTGGHPRSFATQRPKDAGITFTAPHCNRRLLRIAACKAKMAPGAGRGTKLATNVNGAQTMTPNFVSEQSNSSRRDAVCQEVGKYIQTVAQKNGQRTATALSAKKAVETRPLRLGITPLASTIHRQRTRGDHPESLWESPRIPGDVKRHLLNVVSWKEAGVWSCWRPGLRAVPKATGSAVGFQFTLVVQNPDFMAYWKGIFKGRALSYSQHLFFLEWHLQPFL
ncbi:hypothetical protein C8R47DRAFT_1203010 [Mycena vitilis]|nr:hypothetical protein C8R47DRAFT_1203010 [Mycena vitilis]